MFSKYLGIAVPFIGIILYFLQRFYLQTSRQIRLLGIEAKAPLYTSFTESVAGVATIRAFGWQSQYQERNYHLINASQRPEYMLSCVQFCLGFVLEILTAIIATILIAITVTLPNRFTPGSVGVSLVMVVGFSEVLVRLIQSWTKLESSIGAVARVKSFLADTESEETGRTKAAMPPMWPQAGAIEIRDLTASHGYASSQVMMPYDTNILLCLDQTQSQSFGISRCLLSRDNMSPSAAARVAERARLFSA